MMAFFLEASSLEQSKKGLKAYKEQDFSSCIKFLSPHSETLPVSGLLILSKCFQKTKNYKEAQNHLNLLFLKKPDYKPALYFQAELYNLQNKKDKVIHTYNRIIFKYSKDKKAYDLLLEVLIQQNSHYETKELLLDMIKRFGNKTIYIKKLCKVYLDIKLAVESLEVCQKALKAWPQDEELNIYLAESYFLNSREDQRQKQYIVSSKKFPHSEFVQRVLGDFYFEKKNYSLSYKYYKKAYENKKDSFEALKGFALSSFELKKYKEALELFQKACTLSSAKIFKEFLKAKSVILANNITDWIKLYRMAFESCERTKKVKRKE